MDTLLRKYEKGVAIARLYRDKNDEKKIYVSFIGSRKPEEQGKKQFSDVNAATKFLEDNGWHLKDLHEAEKK